MLAYFTMGIFPFSSMPLFILVIWINHRFLWYFLLLLDALTLFLRFYLIGFLVPFYATDAELTKKEETKLATSMWHSISRLFLSYIYRTQSRDSFTTQKSSFPFISDWMSDTNFMDHYLLSHSLNVSLWWYWVTFSVASYNWRLKWCGKWYWSKRNWFFWKIVNRAKRDKYFWKFADLVDSHG